MSNEMIERVAQAMAEATNGGDFKDGRWYTDTHRELWFARARAGIAAMREPTEAMIEAESLDAKAGDIPGVWRGMVDAALKGE